jgi:hypothetical protein
MGLFSPEVLGQLQRGQVPPPASGGGER